MRVERKEKAASDNTVAFRDVRKGDVFKWSGELFLKTEEQGGLNAVNFGEAHLWKFEDHARVELAEAYVVELV